MNEQVPQINLPSRKDLRVLCFRRLSNVDISSLIKVYWANKILEYMAYRVDR